jgi:RNA-directed DNA polymerase
VVSGRIFTSLDHHVWHLTYRWAKRSHPNKSKGWVAARYFGMFHKSRQDRWVFGDRDSGVYLTKFASTKIVRHVLVHGGASPDDPALAEYWAERRHTPVDEHSARLLQSQKGTLSGVRAAPVVAEHEPRSPASGNSGS